VNKAESKYFNTAKKIDEALMLLLKKKSFEYITVSEICKTAGVNRSTFYLHYEHMGDLLDETARYLIDGFLSYFNEDKKSIAFNIEECELNRLNFICGEYLIPYLTYIKDNKEIFATALMHVKSLGFEKTYSRLFENIFDPILQRFNYPKEDRTYVMKYYLSGINAINTEWLKNGCQKPIEEIANIITECIFGKNYN
jgi:AcrR family transcriptional regulator